jgi:hypothetical protein
LVHVLAYLLSLIPHPLYWRDMIEVLKGCTKIAWISL